MIKYHADQTRSRGRRVLHVGLGLLGVLLLVLSACHLGNARGAETKEQVVSSYLQALEAKDEQSLLLLVPRTHIAEQAVQDKVKRLGGHALQDRQVDYLSDFGPKWARVTIQGTYVTSRGETAKFRDVIYLHQMKDRWYLMLGKLKDSDRSNISKIEIGDR